jgi:hypothetical protein
MAAALLAVLLGWTALVAAPAGATSRGAPPPDVITDALNGTVNRLTPCEGEPQVIPGNGLLKVERPGNTSGTIAVDVTYGGSLVPGTDYEPLPDPIEIAAGESQTIVVVESATPGTVTLTVEPGEGYEVGDPATATLTIGLSAIDAICPDEETLTTTVGGQPPAVPVYDRYGGAYADTILEIEGDLPPGLRYSNDGSWTGAATTAGTYQFVAKYTLGDFAFLELPLRIVVRPRDSGSTTTTTTTVKPTTSSTTTPPARPPARPATPVKARAKFTG